MSFNDTFLRAARGEVTEYTPVWFMRQAGRSLPGYRALRKKYDVLTLTQTPELAAQVSLEPIDLLGVDAAILFADIMLLPIAMGVQVKIVDNVGPVIDNPINSPADLAKLELFEPPKVEFLAETVRLLRNDLRVPLIGFAAAPFTLASYLIEGQPTRKWHKTKRFMLEQPEAWQKLMTILSEATIAYLKVQVAAGAQAVQLFDSWVGCLAASDYRRYVLPYTQRIFAGIAEAGVPRLHFGTDTSGMLADFGSVDAEVIGLDWRIDLGNARQQLPEKVLQGNLDPVVVLAGREIIQRRVDEMLTSLGNRDKYIFNLGHGVLPETNDQDLKFLVEYVHGKK